MTVTEVFSRLPLALVFVLLLSGCATTLPGHKREQSTALKTIPELLDEVRGRGTYSSETLKLVDRGLAAMSNTDFSRANDSFNQALKLDTANSWLQFLNGLSYHLGALQGDSSLYELSEQGYQLAIRFDPSNWIARYHLGLLFLDQKKYALAQEHLAEALLFNERNPDLLYSLVVASYYAHDPRTAAGVLNRLRVEESDSERVLRAECMIHSALGDDAAARESLNLYNSLYAEVQAPAGLDERVNDWKKFYEHFGQRDGSNDPNQLPIVLAAYQVTGQAEAEAGQETRSVTESSTMEVDDSEHKMIIVDVVMVGTEENLTTRKGVNLLNGLSIQFGSQSGPAYSWGETRTQASSSSPYETTKTITKALNIPAINYSLNIFNSQSDRAEILARPTLIALDGETSTFFSGLNIQAATVGDASNNGTSGAVQIKEKVGVSLEIKPTFLDDKSIKLQVHAQRRFLKTPSPDIVYESKIETTETDVSANVIINFGETLVLSGLSEKETERIRDGMPFLQDVPGIQYFFSQYDARDFQRSVLILLTPRSPQYVYRESRGGREGRNGQTSSLNELQARYSDWFKPYPNWASVFHHMQSNSLYREFRTGDVTLEHWAGQLSLKDRLRLALDFLYY